MKSQNYWIYNQRNLKMTKEDIKKRVALLEEECSDMEEEMWMLENELSQLYQQLDNGEYDSP